MAKRRQTDDGGLPMTSMIDVVFLLIIFFVVTLEPVDLFAKLDVFRPAGGPPGVEPEMIKVMVMPGFFTIGILGNDGDKRVDLAGLDAELSHMASLSTEQTISITCAPEAEHAKLIAVLNLCARLKLQNLALTTLQ